MAQDYVQLYHKLLSQRDDALPSIKKHLDRGTLSRLSSESL
jgi:hypothetical protein